ncbi:PAS domain S-box protein [Actinosynnema pretiosum subsp. pretiosum]|uniref:histidine kinase n=2 Tax=Actinosynnema TaxID=40566 RepID=C6WJT1_ACTMD|nr:PAS domain S-box protein [Actinosynnema mirum]ACU36306.1 PAS/PAC sensor signal transduction histidine kinase [Actinosynnema mirum DSM 43827]AXX29759.1 multi-sensor hybrid histidine kinase [Actinosynnema pretiosum subsp. pretiosum]QUF06026.1 PAS domain S-box protein [Actinosynnema pretiosum subsp. pretiosum]
MPAHILDQLSTTIVEITRRDQPITRTRRKALDSLRSLPGISSVRWSGPHEAVAADGDEVFLRMQHGGAVLTGEGVHRVEVVHAAEAIVRTLDAVLVNTGAIGVEGVLDGEEPGAARITTDAATRIVEFSDEAVELLGYRREEAVGKLIVDLLVPEHVRGAFAGLVGELEVVSGEATMPLRFDLPARCADGTEIDLDAVVEQELTPERGLVTTCTLRRIDNSTWGTPEAGGGEFHRALMSRSPVLVLALAEDGTIKWVSAPAETGIDARALAGEQMASAMRFVHPEDRDVVGVAVRQVWQIGGTRRTFEVRMGAAGRAWRLMRVTLRNMLSSPSVGAVVGFAVDVTERGAAERRAREEAFRLRTMVNVLNVGVVQFDERGRVDHANAAALSWLGIDLSPSAVAGTLLQQHLRPIGATRHPVEQIISEGAVDEEITGELELLDGRAVEYSYQPVGLGDERVGALLVMQDVTERVAAQRVLELSNEELTRLVALRTEFVSSMSHELRTPLTVVASSAALLKEESEDSGGVHGQLADAIERNASRLLSVVEDLVDLARLEGGAVTADHSPANITALLGGVMRRIDDRASDRGVRLVVSSEKEAVTVLGDAERLVTMLDYALSAAIGISTEGESVTVSTGVRQGRWVLDVLDPRPLQASGSRMYSAIARLGRWGRADRTAVSTGVSTVLARAIAEWHGGAIEVFGVEDGTVTRVWLPVHAEDWDDLT